MSDARQLTEEDLDEIQNHRVSRDGAFAIKQLRAKVEELKEHYSLQVALIGGKDNYIQSLEAEVNELTYLVTELDAHEGAEGWSDRLEKRLKVWRKQEGKL